MEQTILDMLGSGFTVDGAGQLLSLLVAGAIAATLIRMVQLILASRDISNNQNIAVGTWLLIGHSTGASPCCFAKKTFFKVYLQNADTGGLMIMSTIAFRGMVQHVLPAAPEGVDCTKLFAIKK